MGKSEGCTNEPENSLRNSISRKRIFKSKSSRNRDKLDLPEDSYHNTSIFNTSSHFFDVDVSSKTEAFESNQLTDLYNHLYLQTIIKNESELIEPMDALRFKHEKRTKQKAHILYCGGPISDIKVCPRRTTDGISMSFSHLVIVIK